LHSRLQSTRTQDSLRADAILLTPTTPPNQDPQKDLNSYRRSCRGAWP
jgi:hypothetical protein